MEGDWARETPFVSDDSPGALVVLRCRADPVMLGAAVQRASRAEILVLLF